MWSFGRQRPGASQVLPCAAALAAFFATLLLASAAAFWLGAQPAAEALLRSLIAPSAAHPAPISAEEEPGESIDGEPINGKSSEGESIGGGATRGTDAAAASAFGSDSFLLEENASVPQILEFDLIKTYPHDRRAFTQACSCKQCVVGCKAVVSISAVHAIPVIPGLLYMDHEASGGRGSGEGVFYESTGDIILCFCPSFTLSPLVSVPLAPVPFCPHSPVFLFLFSPCPYPPFPCTPPFFPRAVDSEGGGCGLCLVEGMVQQQRPPDLTPPTFFPLMCLPLLSLSLSLPPQVLNSVPQSADVFGEGLALHDDRLYQLAWRVRSGLVYDRETLRPQGSFQHGMADGWGLAVLNGSVMVGTDGSSTLFHLDSSSFKAVARVTVKDGKRSIPNLNELEVVRGLVWANVWLSNCLAAIHPDTGKVLAWLDLSSLQ
ncbi:unnamed protein product [Closterium sp. NIES-65]|nr:unnamed protein product [Closterium sp. NIES-65]